MSTDKSNKHIQNIKELLIACLVGISYGAGVFWPQTGVGVSLSLLGVLGWVWIYQNSSKLVLSLFVSGFSFYASGYYWMPKALVFFSVEKINEADHLLVWSAYFTFCLLSSFQFVLVGYLAKIFDQTKLKLWLLSFPAAWLIAEFLVPRFFHWVIVNPFIDWHWLSASADIFGVYLPGAILLFLASVIISLVSGKAVQKQILAVSALLIVSLYAYSEMREEQVLQQIADAKKVRIASVQGNLPGRRVIPLDPFARKSLSIYRRLTKIVELENPLPQIIFWPEAISILPTPYDAENVFTASWAPVSSLKVPLVYGSISLRKLSTLPGNEGREGYTRQNGLISIDTKGNVKGRYFKQKLMPFGEYVPLENILPWLKNLARRKYDFLVGSEDQKPVKVSKTGALLAPSICYEDLYPEISRRMVVQGANVLLALANNVWFMGTPANDQHHLLGSWRALETRRFQIKVNNTGPTAIVDPFGKTIQKIPYSKPMAMHSKISLMEEKTLYVQYGNLFSWLVIGSIAIFTLYSLIVSQLLQPR